MPGDMIVGAYLPWLEQIPVKNPIISDVFSQIYIWKSLVAESYRHFQWPLWNPYSYSGYPLLANVQSSAFSPTNLFMILLGDNAGWTAMIIFGVLGSLVSMYFLLRILGYRKDASIIGAVVYAFSGYAMVSMQFATVSQALVWIPWLFILIEKKKYLHKLPIIIFLIATSGHFQALIYSAILASIYFIYKTRSYKTWVVLGITGLLLSAAQILPTLELFKYAVRSGEDYISHYNYGLFPPSQVLTLLTPDFFGNPITRNHWGFWNYHETTIYLGIFSLLSLIFCLYNWKKLKNEKFFLITALVTLFLALDTPLGKLIYFLQIPGLSTSGGGRIVMLFTFASSVLAAYAYQNINTVKKFWGVALTFVVMISLVLILKFLNIDNMMVALRNFLYPVLIFGALIFVLKFLRGTRFLFWAVLAIVIFDLFKFGWKYNPFVDKKLIFPEVPAIQMLKKEIGYARMDRENGEIMPPNTWAAYRFMSPSGYDPLALTDYTSGYQRILNKNPYHALSRYSELDHYDSVELAKFGVKYFWAIKRNERAELGGKVFTYKLDMNKWRVIYSENRYDLLENLDYKSRVGFLNNTGLAEITTYSPNHLSIKYSTEIDSILTISDTWYPGWKAILNNQPTNIYKYDDIFRKIEVPKGQGTIEMDYDPLSFRLGFLVTILTAVGFLAYTSKRSPK